MVWLADCEAVTVCDLVDVLVGCWLGVATCEALDVWDGDGVNACVPVRVELGVAVNEGDPE